MTTQDSGLPGMEVADDLRHPMWTKPEPGLPDIIYRLHKHMWADLQRFDGRQDMSEVLIFAQEVHDLSKTATDGTAYTLLIGQILLKAEVAKRMVRTMGELRGERWREYSKRDEKVLTALAHNWVQVIVSNI